MVAPVRALRLLSFIGVLGALSQGVFAPSPNPSADRDSEKFRGTFGYALETEFRGFNCFGRLGESLE